MIGTSVLRRQPFYGILSEEVPLLMATPFQMQMRNRVMRYVEREGLTSMMNKTKWSRLLCELDLLPFTVEFRFQDVLDVEREPTPWDPDRAHTFGGFMRSIEWLELRPCQLNDDPRTIEAAAVELRQSLLNAHLPISIVNGNLRVWGYIRPGACPQWESVR